MNAKPARKYTFNITHYPAITSFASQKYYMIRYEYLGELQALLGHLVIYSIAVALQKFLKTLNLT